MSEIFEIERGRFGRVKRTPFLRENILPFGKKWKIIRPQGEFLVDAEASHFLILKIFFEHLSERKVHLTRQNEVCTADESWYVQPIDGS